MVNFEEQDEERYSYWLDGTRPGRQLVSRMCQYNKISQYAIVEDRIVRYHFDRKGRPSKTETDKLYRHLVAANLDVQLTYANGISDDVEVVLMKPHWSKLPLPRTALARGINQNCDKSRRRYMQILGQCPLPQAKFLTSAMDYIASSLDFRNSKPSQYEDYSAFETQCRAFMRDVLDSNTNWGRIIVLSQQQE